MSNPTTPFSWQMPTATDLVTDLPADFEVFGQAVATSMADLLGGTTGQVLSKTSNTDMDFTWINNDQGDITAVTAGTGISGGGTSGAVTITNSMQTTITAAGDILYGTGSAAVARLGIGTAGQVLQVNPGATAPEWAAPGSGSQTILASGTLSGTTTLSTISSGYKDLRLYLRNVDMTGDCTQRITVNSVTNYRYTALNSSGNTGSANGAAAATYIPLALIDASGSSTNNSAMVNFYDYATAGSGNRMIDAVMDTFSSGSAQTVFKVFGVAVTTSAISSITITPSANSYTTGTYELIGIK